MPPPPPPPPPGSPSKHQGKPTPQMSLPVGRRPIPYAAIPSNTAPLPHDDNDLRTEYPDAIKLRWRGSEMGPYNWEQVDQMLRNRKIGLLHEVFWLGKWSQLKVMIQKIDADRSIALDRAKQRDVLRQEQMEAERKQVEEEQRREHEIILQSVEMEQSQQRETREHEIRLKEIELKKTTIKSDSSSTLSEQIVGAFVILIVVGLIGAGLYFAFAVRGFSVLFKP